MSGHVATGVCTHSCIFLQVTAGADPFAFYSTVFFTNPAALRLLQHLHCPHAAGNHRSCLQPVAHSGLPRGPARLPGQHLLAAASAAGVAAVLEQLGGVCGGQVSPEVSEIAWRCAKLFVPFCSCVAMTALLARAHSCSVLPAPCPTRLSQHAATGVLM